MADWFDFKGVRSTSLGVYVQDFPPATLPEERAEFVDIPGRSGSLTVLEGAAVYDDIILTINCYVRDITQLDAISAWLRGRGALVLGNMPNRYYDARNVNQVEMAKILRGRQHRSFPAVFRCKPYRYVYPAPAVITKTVSGQTITNPGTADAEPLIVVTGSGDVTLTIGAKTVQIAGLASKITIDVAAGLAYNGDVNLTGTLTGDWPMTIPPGTSTVSWAGSVTKVEITPGWRYI